MRLRCLRQGQRRPNNRPQLPGFAGLAGTVAPLGSAAGSPDDAQCLTVQSADVDLDNAAAVGSTRDQSSAPGQAGKCALPEGRIRDVLADDVYTAAISDAPYLGREILDTIVDAIVGTVRDAGFHPFIGSGGRDNGRTSELGDLDESAAEGTRRAHDQNPLARLELS